MLLAAVFLPAALAASAVVTESEDLHQRGTPDCGDGKTSSKLGAKWLSFPVTTNTSSTNDTWTTAIRAAFATWDAQEHPPGPFFSERGSAGQDIDVSFAPIDGPSNVLARTSYSYNRFTREFIEVNIVFDSAEAWTVYEGITCYSQGSGIDVEAVAAHEIGHAVGLGHSSSSTALTMYPYYGSGATHQRTLATGDAKGFDNLY